MAKRVAIMQPYFFPYIGYFQLIHAIDEFVFLDDVNFIKGGWINRNRINNAGKPLYLTVPLMNQSQNEAINRTLINQDSTWKTKSEMTVKHLYGKAPYFESVFELYERVIQSSALSIAEMAAQSIATVCNYLGIEFRFHDTSTLKKNFRELKGEGRIIQIAESLGGTRYLNLPGGRILYDKENFQRQGIALEFIEPAIIPYKQFSEPFLPGLSILDVLMFNAPEVVREMLSNYRIVPAE